MEMPNPQTPDTAQLAIIQNKLFLDNKIRSGVNWFFLDRRAISSEHSHLFVGQHADFRNRARSYTNCRWFYVGTG
jgi:hypothetical protein